MTESIPATAIVFTSTTCPHCPAAKKALLDVKSLRDDVETHILQTNTPQGQRLAQKFNVMSVPTFIFYGPGHEAPIGLVGSQSNETLHKYIDIALGKRELKTEKKSFLGRLFRD